MADGLDLGKQVGPLPLGAWVVVVGAGLGIAYYARRQNVPPEIVESGNGEPGVGVGGSGVYTQLTPVVPSQGNTRPTTNEEWGTRAIQYLVQDRNQPLQTADQAVRKFLGGLTLSASEYTLISLAVIQLGYPPQLLPPSSGGEGPGDPNNSIPSVLTVNEGTHVDPWIAQVNATYPGLDLTKTRLKLLNPGIRIAKANQHGYITYPGNPEGRPGGGPTIEVFNVGTSKEVKIR